MTTGTGIWDRRRYATQWDNDDRVESYNTYIKTFKELDSFGFIKVLQKSSNQYSSNIIALSKFDKATSKQHESNSKALDKATLKQVQKQHESNCSVDIPIQQYNNTTINQHTNTLENIIKKKSDFAETLKPFLETYGKDFLNEFYEYWTEPNKSNTKMRFELQKTWSIDLRLKTWAKNDKNFKLKTNSNHGSTSTKLTATEKTDKLKRDFAEKFINEIQHGTDIAPSEDGGYAVVQWRKNLW